MLLTRDIVNSDNTCLVVYYVPVILLLATPVAYRAGSKWEPDIQIVHGMSQPIVDCQERNIATVDSRLFRVGLTGVYMV